MAEPIIEPKKVGARWDYTSPQGGRLSFDFGAVEPQRGGLYCWVELYKPDDPIPIHFGTYNLRGARTVPEVSRATNGSFPPELINSSVYDVIRRHDAGETIVDLSTLEGNNEPWFLLPRLVAAGGATHLIAAGGSLKSYLALHVSFAVATADPRYLGVTPTTQGNVLFCDWEATQGTFQSRSWAIHDGRKPPPGVFYQAQKQPLRRSADAIAKRCDELGVVLVVVDSMMLARGGDAFGPDETIMLFAAIREIGRPALIIDHKSQEAIRKGRKGAYGSIVGANSIRLTWEVIYAQKHEGGMDLVLEQGKSNDIPAGPNLGYKVSIVNEADRLKSIEFLPTNPQLLMLGAVPEGDEVADRMDRALREVDNEPQLVSWFEERGCGKAGTVRMVLKRNTARFEEAPGGGRGGKRYRLKVALGPRERHLTIVPDDDETGGFVPPEEDPF